MALWKILLTSFVLGLTGAISPGPLLTVAISKSARKGWTMGPLLICGHAVAELAMVLLLFAGLGRALAMGRTKTIIQIAGGIVLVWMGYTIIRDSLKDSLNVDAEYGSPNVFGPIVSGMVVSLLNPYWFLWWVTIGASFIGLSLNSGIPGVSTFFLGHILADFFWYTLVGIGTVKSCAYLGSKAYRIVLLACGVFMTILGVAFLISGTLFLTP